MKIDRIIFCAALIVAGCSPLAPRRDYTKYYILTPISLTADTDLLSNSRNTQLVLGIGPIDFPDYLRRPQMVTRAAPNLIDLSPVERWAEPLDKNFTRVLTENLTQLLHTQRVEKYPWSSRTNIDYQIVVDVQRFEIVEPGNAQLVARWAIKSGDRGRDLYASETNISQPIPAGEPGASVALSSDVAALSSQIASQITLLNQHRFAPQSPQDTSPADTFLR